MSIARFVLLTANLYFALINGIRFAQTGDTFTGVVGLVNAIACGGLIYSMRQQVKAQKEWDEMVRKRTEEWDHIGT